MRLLGARPPASSAIGFRQGKVPTMPYSESAVARLHHLAVQLRQQHGMELGKAWAVVLDAKDDSTFFKRYALVVSLAEDAFAELERAGGSNPQAYTKKFGNVRRLFQMSLNNGVQHAHEALDEATMTMLEFGAHRCSEIAPKAEIDDSQLESLLRDARDLRAIIESDSDMPQAVREAILQRLDEIIVMLGMMPLYGIKSVRDRVYSTLGVLGADMLERGEKAKSTGNRSVVAFLQKALVGLAVVNSTIDTGKRLAEVMAGFLPK